MSCSKLVFAVFYLFGFLLYSCSSDPGFVGPSISFSVPTSGLQVEIGKSLQLVPTIENDQNASYQWSLNGQPLSNQKVLVFSPSKIGDYTLQLKVTNNGGSDTKSLDVKAFSTYSPYITKVFDYQYGPGQHASLIPANWKGDDFVGSPWTNNKTYTSLGGWGGYIVAGFDHDIVNQTGPDFGVFVQPGPSSEPAVIYVMADSNGDGLPNDGDWIELKGSEYTNPETIHGYQMTYSKPIADGNVTWKDNQGKSGELKPVFTSGSWWWGGYGSKSEVTFSGCRLPDAYINDSKVVGVENWIVRPGMFTFGYGECYNNGDYNSNLKANLFDLDNAVDLHGNKVTVSAIRFIKVQSSVFQIAGWLNEVSTEVSGAVDISLINY